MAGGGEPAHPRGAQQTPAVGAGDHREGHPVIGQDGMEEAEGNGGEDQQQDVHRAFSHLIGV